MRLHVLVLVSASALAASHGVGAQMYGGGTVTMSPGDWEFRIGPVWQESKNVTFNGGSNADINRTTGVKIGTGVYVTPQLAIGGNFAWSSTSFNGTVKGNLGTSSIENGEIYNDVLNFDAIYTILDGPIKPYGVAGLGWNWIDTNIANGPPQTGCWWDPWWGYVCSGYQPTKSSSGFTWQVGAGVQFNFSRAFAVDLDYRYTWIDLQHANGTPGLGTIQLMFVWRAARGY